jgi:hypothetical protein
MSHIVVIAFIILVAYCLGMMLLDALQRPIIEEYERKRREERDAIENARAAENAAAEKASRAKRKLDVEAHIKTINDYQAFVERCSAYAREHGVPYWRALTELKHQKPQWPRVEPHNWDRFVSCDWEALDWRMRVTNDGHPY